MYIVEIVEFDGRSFPEICRSTSIPTFDQAVAWRVRLGDLLVAQNWETETQDEKKTWYFKKGKNAITLSIQDDEGFSDPDDALSMIVARFVAA